MLAQLVDELGGVVTVRVVADVRASGGVRLLVAVNHRLADRAVATDVAGERLIVIVVHAMTGHMMFQWSAEWTTIAAVQLVLAEVDAQVIPELDLRHHKIWGMWETCFINIIIINVITIII